MPHASTRRAVTAAAALCAAMAFAPAHGIYKWVDEKGVTHFSEHPPPDGRKATKVEPKVTPPSSPAAKPVDWKQRELDARQRKLEKEQKEDFRKATEHNEGARRQNRCAYARQQVGILSTQVPVYSTNERGERAYLEDRDRAAELAQWKREIEATCDR